MQWWALQRIISFLLWTWQQYWEYWLFICCYLLAMGSMGFWKTKVILPYIGTKGAIICFYRLLCWSRTLKSFRKHRLFFTFQHRHLTWFSCVCLFELYFIWHSNCYSSRGSFHLLWTKWTFSTSIKDKIWYRADINHTSSTELLDYFCQSSDLKLFACFLLRNVNIYIT